MIVEGEEYSTTLSITSECTLDSVVVTMDSVDITSSCYSSGTITISEVTGDIVITAIAKAEEFTQIVENTASGARMVTYYHADTGVAFTNGNFGTIIGVSDENECAIATRESTTIYLIPIPSEATKVTITTTDVSIVTCSYLGVDYSDGSYTKKFYGKELTAFSYEFEKGSAEYLGLTVFYDESVGTKMAWSYDPSQVTVTFTNY